MCFYVFFLYFNIIVFRPSRSSKISKSPVNTTPISRRGMDVGIDMDCDMSPIVIPDSPDKAIPTTSRQGTLKGASKRAMGASVSTLAVQSQSTAVINNQSAGAANDSTGPMPRLRAEGASFRCRGCNTLAVHQ